MPTPTLPVLCLAAWAALAAPIVKTAAPPAATGFPAVSGYS